MTTKSETRKGMEGTGNVAAQLKGRDPLEAVPGMETKRKLREALDLICSRTEMKPEVRSYLEKRIEGGMMERGQALLLGAAEPQTSPLRPGERDCGWEAANAKRFAQRIEREMSLMQHAPELLAEIMKNGICGMKQVASKIVGGPTDAVMVADCIKTALDVEYSTGRKFPELTDKLVGILIALDDGRYGWIVSACEVFSGRPDSVPFLEDPERLGAAERLIDFMVAHAIRWRDIYCMECMPKALLKYNLGRITAENLDRGFPFKPKTQWDAFIRLLPNHRGAGAYDLKVFELFCRYDSPKQFLHEVATLGISLRGLCSFERTCELFEMWRDSYPEIHDYRSPAMSRVGADGYIRGVIKARNATEEVLGLFVHAEALIKPGGGWLDYELLRYVKECAERGRKVVIFTTDISPEEAEKELHSHGITRQFPQFSGVVEITQFRGKILEEIISSTPPEYWGIRDKHW